MGKFDGAIPGDEQAGIDQTADDAIRRTRQRSTRDDTPEQALAFDRALVDPNEVAREGALQASHFVSCRFRIGRSPFELRRDRSLHAAQTAILIECEAPIRTALLVQRL